VDKVDKVTVFLPCRKGSERVPRKNIRKLGKYKHGLIEIKLFQLSKCNLIDEIILSTNDEEIIEFANSLNLNKLTIHLRKESLSSSETMTDELIQLVPKLIHDGIVIWTHVTAPFVTAKIYDLLIENFFQKCNAGFDSLITTSKLQTFIWSDDGPINYNRDVEKWPRTQDLPALYEINSAVFISNISSYTKLFDRVGSTPYLYNLDKIRSIDVDWMDDFVLAEKLIESGAVEIE
jgi:CMP-N-acetylneuraminic acid synthetase